MGIVTINEELPSKVSATRLFKGLITDNHNLNTKIDSLLNRSAANINGDGGAGSIKQRNYVNGGVFSCVKVKIDELDETQFICKLHYLEGGGLSEKIENIDTEIKCEPSSEGGCIVKMKRAFTMAEGAEIDPDLLEGHKMRAKNLFAGVEDYLLKNPDVYA